MKIKTYVDAKNEHRWNVTAANGKIIASGEGYKRKSSMLRILRKLFPGLV